MAIKTVYWTNEDGSISNNTIRKMIEDSTLTIISETGNELTIKWSDGEIETFTKQIRIGRQIVN